MLKIITDFHKIEKLIKTILPIIVLGFLLVSLVLPAVPTLAADYGLKNTAETAFDDPNISSQSVPRYLGRLAGAALALSGSIFLFLIVWGGIWIMTASGNETKLQKGKSIITWAIIGVLVLGAAYAITSLVFTAISGGDPGGGASPTP